MKKIIKPIFILIFISIFQSCQTLPNKGIINEQLQNLQELGTSEYKLSKVIIAEDNQWYSIGDRKVVITMKASVKAGVDFSEIKIININNDEKSISLSLPKSKIILLDIKPNDIKYNFLKTTLARSEFTNKELNEIQVLGEKSIKDKISELNILEDANKNAKLFLTNWLKLSGFNKIKFS